MSFSFISNVKGNSWNNTQFIELNHWCNKRCAMNENKAYSTPCMINFIDVLLSSLIDSNVNMR
jgi:hypothetical protein